MISEGISGLKAFFFHSRRMKVFSVWFFFIAFLLGLNIVGESDYDRAVAVSAFSCGGSMFFFWNYRKKISHSIHGRWNPRKTFVLIGGLGAVWTEFIFWFFEKLFGTAGVAASPNLGVDLLITMPWYILMCYLLFAVETRYNYSLTEILLLGGIYELGADGILGQMLEGAGTGLIYVFGVIPLFVMVYSVIVLPPSYIMHKEIAEIRKTRSQKTHKLYGLLPLAGLVPFAVYVIVLLSLFGA
jgi:hypothetical protein